jgi:hypothetical protein
MGNEKTPNRRSYKYYRAPRHRYRHTFKLKKRRGLKDITKQLIENIDWRMANVSIDAYYFLVKGTAGKLRKKYGKGIKRDGPAYILRKADWTKSVNRLAKDFSLHPHTVRRVRNNCPRYKALNIKPAVETAKDWDWTQRDSHLAREHGVTKEYVAVLRKANTRLKTPPVFRYTDIDWDSLDWLNKTDKELSEETGAKLSSITSKRYRNYRASSKEWQFLCEFKKLSPFSLDGKWLPNRHLRNIEEGDIDEWGIREVRYWVRKERKRRRIAKIINRRNINDWCEAMEDIVNDEIFSIGFVGTALKKGKSKR